MKKINFLIVALIMLFSKSFAGGYNVGDKASDFKLENVNGKWVSLSDYKDAKGFIVIFTTNHCPFAKAYQDRIIALNNEFMPKGYPVIAINPNDPTLNSEDSFENMQIRAKEKGFTFPYLFDAKQTVYPEYGATHTPHVFVLSKENDGLRVEYIGAIDDNYADPSAVKHKYVEDAVNALLSGTKPEVTFTKAIGCSIKSRME